MSRRSLQTLVTRFNLVKRDIRASGSCWVQDLRALGRSPISSSAIQERSPVVHLPF
ncbi:hypothetical protein [Scytonema sp. PCC 10023]|uniref:hypothetical protein n=1 Tax=Scytonema sp. PCC 10023 TaxID=1680591 RepID=UPI0039C5D625